jgi:hypothetical protein
MPALEIAMADGFQSEAPDQGAIFLFIALFPVHRFFYGMRISSPTGAAQRAQDQAKP